MVKTIRRAAIYLAPFELWVVICLVGMSIVFTRTLPLVIMGAGLFWFIRWLAYGYGSIRTPADGAIILLIVMIIVTLWVTDWPATTYPQVYRLLSGIALYYAIVNWTTSIARYRLLITGVVLAAFLLALSAPVSVTWSLNKLSFIPASIYNHFTLLVSDTVNPNVMAGNLLLLLPCPLALLVFGWRQLHWSYRLLTGITVLAIINVLILTQSRGGLLTIVTILLVMTFLRWRRGWLLFPLVIIGAVVVYLINLAGHQQVAITPDLSSTTTDIRLEIWSHALTMIRDFPITGIGMGSFQVIANQWYPFSSEWPGGTEHAHNLFLQVAIDLGLPGLVAWLAILMLVLTSAWQIYQHGQVRGEGWLTGLGAGLLCSQVALVTYGLTDAVTWGMVRPAPLVWGLWGLAMAGSYLLLHKPDEIWKPVNSII